MISILTPRYTKSDWCVKEANEFYDVCKTNIGFSVNNKARIFKVIKTPLKIEQHPESIRNILGYEFYSSDPTTGRLKEFSQQLGQQTEKLYWDKMDDLANDIAAFLEDLESYDDGNSNVQEGGNGNSQKEGLKILETAAGAQREGDRRCITVPVHQPCIFFSLTKFKFLLDKKIDIL
jgi:hypothetical protein